MRPENRRLAARIEAAGREQEARARRAALTAGGAQDVEPPTPVPLDDLDERDDEVVPVR